MQINQLPTIPQAPANADVLPIESNNVTYKVSKQVLAESVASNITPANIEAVAKSGDTMTGNLNIFRDQCGVFLGRTDGTTKGVDIYTSASEGGKMKLYSADGVHVYWLDTAADGGKSFRIVREALDGSLTNIPIFKITPAGDVVPVGNVDMGQNAANTQGRMVQWTGADGTKFMIRPYGSMFQIINDYGGALHNLIGLQPDGTVNTEYRGKWRTGLGIQSGAFTAASTDGGTYTDTQVTFPTAFASPPNVVVGFRTGSTAAAFGHCSCAVVPGSITTTGCTIRFFNGDTTARLPEITWIAIGG